MRNLLATPFYIVISFVVCHNEASLGADVEVVELLPAFGTLSAIGFNQ